MLIEAEWRIEQRREIEARTMQWLALHRCANCGGWMEHPPECLHCGGVISTGA